jgi:RNA polymerase sigma factor (sigma-70 family)
MAVTEHPAGRREADVAVPDWRYPDRFAALFDAFHNDIYRYAASRLSSAAADDVAAETFLVAYRDRAGFAGPDAHVRSWLFGIATNLIRRHHRNEERRYRALARSGAVSAVADGDALDERVTARVSAGAVQRNLAEALRALKAGDRDVLLLVALAGLNYAEVAAALGIPPGTVGSRLNRARTAMRAALGFDPDFTPLESTDGRP